MSGWHYLDLEEAIMINCQLRQADWTVYLEIDDFVIYVKITLVINVTIYGPSSLKNIEKSVYHQCILNDQILKIIFIKKISCHY